MAALAAAAFLAVSGGASAGGLEFPDLGTVALGRGAAFTARADNLSAFYYNPAGLSKSTGINVLLGANIVNLDLRYTRFGSGGCWVEEVGGRFIESCESDPASACPAGEICLADPALDHGDFPDAAAAPFAGASSGHNWGALPMLVANWGDVGGVKGLAIAVGLVPPSSFGTPTFEKDGAQRYALIEANHLIVFPGVGISYTFNRYLQVGATFLSGFGHFRQSQAIRPLPQPNDVNSFNERRIGDAIVAIEAKDNFIPSGTIGVMSNPFDWLELGIAVKMPAYINAKGKVKYTPSEWDLPDSRLVDGEDGMTLKQHFPWVVRAGLRYIHRRFDIEFDVVWENWSSLRSFEVGMDAVLFDGNYDEIEMPDVDLPKNFKDTYSYRIGGDVEVWPEHLAIRLGGFYQSSAYPGGNETFSVDFPYAEQFGIGGGLTWHTCEYLDVNAGYMHIFQPDIVVERGIVQQQGLPYTPDPMNDPDTQLNVGNVVNGGRYEVGINIFGLSLEGHFL
jgi:long-chain fatty acid transport protein